MSTDFLMSTAQDDPNPTMRRVALRAVSGPMGKRVIIRTNHGMIDGTDMTDLGHGSLGQFPDDFEETILEPSAEMVEFPRELAEIEKGKAERLKDRMDELKDRIHVIPPPKVQADQPEPQVTSLPESPSKKPTDNQ